MSPGPPSAVLSEALADSIGGSQVRAAVFTTYELDPGFFELEILPTILPSVTVQHERVRLAQLESAIPNIYHGIEVFYDSRALEAQQPDHGLGVRWIPIRWLPGVFHPKVAMLLLENDSGEQSLLSVCASANLTRTGWWENVEAGHITELRSGELTFLRDDIDRFLAWLYRRRPPGASLTALAEIRAFVRRLVQRRRAATDNLWFESIHGSHALAERFVDIARQRVGDLEVLSPFFDAPDIATPGSFAVERLIEQVRPNRARVLLPLDQYGEPTISEATYRHLAAIPTFTWSDRWLGDSPLARQGPAGLRRGVHAKVYRFVSEDRELILLGSANATLAAWTGRNVECCVLIDRGHEGPTAWLVSRSTKPEQWPGEDELEEGADERRPPPSPVLLEYDWGQEAASAFWYEPVEEPLPVDAAGVRLFAIAPGERVGWARLPDEQAEKLRAHLASGYSRLLTIPDWPEKGDVIEVLVLESSTELIPRTRLADLSAREILRCWAEITQEDKADYLEVLGARHGWTEEEDEADPNIEHVGRDEAVDSFFDQFAGVFQAFERLSTAIETAISERLFAEADRWLFPEGATLLTLVRRLESADDRRDPVMDLVQALSAADLLDRVQGAKRYARLRASKLASLKAEVNAVLERSRDALLDTAPDREGMSRYLTWFESEYLKPPRARH